ncbi:EAL domain-containing response regulator [Chitinimonas arctica]|uniref:EAL domain-containing response regulator n=1 Tax=Chitinimonas arctica TaxID=2594795 RepID=A0A516SCG6_9NEIS|nr:EAL domain-containing response regulator [Chitinimonas arctica]QDQ25847.1 EAL domain-containing response regulator [Chitinimonas arctica]
MKQKSDIKVLVLDDEPFTLKLLARVLTNQGFTQVVTCGDGESALAWVDSDKGRPDVILCDLNMPHMDGIEFVRKLVEHGYAGSLVLVSKEDERVLQSVEMLVHSHGISVLGCLHKPVFPQALAMLLDKQLHRVGTQHVPAAKIYSADELRVALSKDELINYYQPKVSLSIGELVGVETLVRWRHPVDGMVFPDQFVGVAEEHGLIDELTRVVLQAALTQAKRWQEIGLRLKIAINVSMDNLTSLDFPSFVSEQAMLAIVRPQDVVLEVTESKLMKDQRASLEILTRLRLKRFRLSIDDFGTGHSSLAQLRDIPFDELKIDKSFVNGVHANETIRAIYLASVSLAKQLRMEVVAEGVESRDDWDFLRQTGCDLAQGYFISPPMPASELPAWAAGWTQRIRQGLLLGAAATPCQNP